MTDASVVIRDGAGAGSEHPLHGELTVGREQGAGLVIDDGGVSRLHARFLDENGAIVALIFRRQAEGKAPSAVAAPPADATSEVDPSHNPYARED